MGKAYIICTDRFPDGDAGAVRAESFAFMLRSIGYEPFVIGLGKSTGFETKSCRGLQYVSLRSFRQNILHRAADRLLFSLRVKRLLKKTGVCAGDVIFVESCPLSLLRFLKRMSGRTGASLIHDAVEWFSPGQFKSGTASITYKRNNKLNSKLLDKSLGVVSISTYLEKHFAGRNVKTVRIPAVLDVAGMPCGTDTDDSGTVRIVYAGMPGNKDRLLELIAAVCELRENEQNRLHVRVIGVDRDFFVKKWWRDRDRDIPRSVYFEGRQPRSYVLNAVADADFAFLLRPCEERYAKAGFPTKVAESCACGTAMLCNYSSDLDMFLKDGENSIIISDCSANSCLSALRRILELDPEQIKKLKQNARKTAEDSFCREKYADSLRVLTEREIK